MEDLTNRIHPTDSSLVTYIDSLRKKEYQIPTFQRSVVWDELSVKKLWDSIYKFYPMGSILVWKTPMKLHNHKEVGGHVIADDVDRNEYKYILDGQQRTTALLTSLYGGRIEGREGFNPQLYVDLTVDDDGDTDDEAYKRRFLFWSEIDDSRNKKNAPKMKLYNEGLVVKLIDIKEKFESLFDSVYKTRGIDSLEKKLLMRIKNVLDNYRLSFIELSGIHVSEVCQIFERINQSGQPLDIFDIVVAKTYAPKEENGGFYLRDVIDNFRRINNSPFMNIPYADYLQVIAVLIRLDNPDSGIMNITDKYLNMITTEQIKSVWNDTQDALLKTFGFLENYLHLQPYFVPYRYFYLALAAYFFRNKTPDYGFLMKYFWYYSFHKDDLLSNTTDLKKHLEFLRGSADMSCLPPFVLDRDMLRTAKYSAKGRMSRAVLALYASREPRDWKDGIKKVNVSNFFVSTDKPNLHHIFPTESDYVRKHGCVDQNSLMNIAFITQETNLEISNRDPVEYLRGYFSGNFMELMPEHYLPKILADWTEKGSLPDDAIPVFIAKRIALIEEDLQKKLDGVDFQTIDTRANQA